MAIARTQNVAAKASSATLTSTNSNDLIVVFAYDAGTVPYLVLATTTPVLIVPGIGRRCNTASACTGRLRPERGVLGLRLRPDHRGGPGRRGLGPRAAGGIRDAVADHGHGRPQDRRDRRPTVRVRWSSNPLMVPARLLSWNMNSDGSLKHLLKCEHGGTLFMDGKEVFRRAVRVVVESAERAMTDAGLARRRHLLDGAPPGQPADHPGGLPALGDPRRADRGGHRPLRQYLVCLHPIGALRLHHPVAASTTATPSS